MDEKATKSSFQDTPESGVAANLSERCVHCVKKLKAEPISAVL